MNYLNSIPRAIASQFALNIKNNNNNNTIRNNNDDDEDDAPRFCFPNLLDAK